MIYANFIFEGHNGNYHEDQDSEDQLVDIQWYCSESCYRQAGHTETGAYPCGSETDYCVFCDHCGDFIWQGLSCDTESCRHNEGA